jgi:hypothetical protein
MSKVCFRKTLHLPSSRRICIGWTLWLPYVGHIVGGDLDGAYWWSIRACCYPIGNEHRVEENENIFNWHMVRRGDKQLFHDKW